MKKDVECKLHTKASEEVQKAIAKELNVPDRPIAEILNDKEPSDNDRDTREGETRAE